MGPLPTDTDRLMFKAHQTYSNGDVVNWDQDPGNGGQEPEHPAPTVRLVSATAAKDASARVAAGPSASASSSDDGTARVLGGVGLAVGIIGVAVGGYSLTRKHTS